ncbi:glycosyltransferase family 2 protein [Bergeyella porcorum]|uniref:glycosyltransferase family 2 protein n=1 Tax=Bergeyella porcorum TaxID=1735111 RepID=UPI0035ECB4F5
MKFSILIAHYNNFEYFKDCYTSIIQQTFQDFEVIIVDDCSTDGSFEKVKDWIKEDSRFKIFQNEENKGVGYTKKKCIELANGEICGFLDPDDALASLALETCVRCYTDNSLVAVYSQCSFCDEKMNHLFVLQSNTSIKNNNPLFFNIFFEVNHFFTFRKDAYLKTLGIDESLKVAEDQDLYLKLYEVGNFKFVKTPLYLYRRHSQGLSQDIDIRKIEQKKKDWTKVLFTTLQRRGINTLYGKKINEIKDLPTFIYNNQNTIWKRISRKLKEL